MSFNRVIVHAVWGTRNKLPVLEAGIRKKVIDHIEQNASLKNIYIHSLNGHVDHLHCLFTLNPEMSLSKALQLIKGESSYWINKNKLTTSRFEWEDEYYASSVSESDLVSVNYYIRRQDEHHTRKTFAEEYEELLNGTALR